MTGIEVAQNALMNINSYKYLYGAKGEVATSAQIESLITAYPSHFNTDSRKSAARAKAGYRCIDCSGYVCLAMGVRSIGSWQLFEAASQKLTMHFTNNKWMAGGTYIPYGAVLWKPGHVGIYIGNQQSAEAVSEESDLQINNIDGRGFTHALLFDEGAVVIDYAANLDDAALSVPASLVQPSYIPWIGKIINAEEVVPKIAPDGTAPYTYFGALHNGEQIRVTGLYGDYYHVENDSGLRGYINSYYIGNLNAPAYDSGYITWTGQVSGADNHVNVRIAPRTTAALHGTFPELPNGTQVRVTGETLGTEDLRLWYQVTLSDNSTAFIRADLVNPVVISNYTAWNGKAQSTTGTVNIRSAATVNSSLSQLHAPLSNGDSVTVTGETMGSDGYRWYSVSIDGTAVGYCRCDLIVPAYEDYYEEWYATIQTGTGSGNLRVGPGTNYNTVTGSPFANGTLVHIEGEADGADGYVWYQLTELSGYRRGYIRADLVQAASNYPNWAVYAETVTGTLNIRSGPGTGFALSGVVSSVPNGKELTVISQTLGTDLKIWYQVKVDGVTAGYVRSDLVIAARPKAYAEWTATAASNTGVVNIRSGPSTNTAVINGYPQMNNGDQCTVYGQVEGPDDGRVWYKVKVMNTWFGYVRADLLSHGTTVTLTHGYAKWNGKLQGATQNVNIRTDAGTGYDIAATLPNGTNVEVIGTKNGADNYVWYQVRTSGAAGYVRSDLVVHAGDTIGDNPYTVVSWQGKMVTNQPVNVYDYPMATEEASYPVPMGTYFLISEKVFDSNGGVWYHGTAEDGVVDQNNNAVSGFIRESEVKVFPKTIDCLLDENDLTGHSYYLCDYDVVKECEKCGAHWKYRKPPKGVHEFPVTNSLTDIVNLIYELEESYIDYKNSLGLDAPSNYEMTMKICNIGRNGPYSSTKWNLFLFGEGFDNGFDEFIQNNNENLYIRMNQKMKNASVPRVDLGYLYVSDARYGYYDLKHFLATLQAYVYRFSLDDPNVGTIPVSLVPPRWLGWGGDLATLAKCIHPFSTLNDGLNCAIEMMGKSDIENPGIFSNQETLFSWYDLLADVDAIGVSKLINSNLYTPCTHFLSLMLKKYYLIGETSAINVNNRKKYLMEDIFREENPSDTSYASVFGEVLYMQYERHIVAEIIEELLPDLIPFVHNANVASGLGGDATDEDHHNACLAFAKYICSESNNFSMFSL